VPFAQSKGSADIWGRHTQFKTEIGNVYPEFPGQMEWRLNYNEASLGRQHQWSTITLLTWICLVSGMLF